MKTIFKDFQNASNFLSLTRHPKYLLKLNALFSKAGFKDILHNEQDILDRQDGYEQKDFFREELTLFVKPIYQTSRDLIEVNNRSEVRTHLRGKGFQDFPTTIRKPNYKDLEEIKIKIQTPQDNRTQFVGVYYRKANAVIIPFKLFYNEWDNSDFSFFLDFYKKILAEFKKLKPKKQDITKALEDLQLEEFIKTANTSLIGFQNEFSDNQNEINDLSEKLVERTAKIKVLQAQIKSMQIFAKDKKNFIIKKYQEIKELPFVKEVGLTKEGIAVYIGEVELNTGKDKVQLGRFRIYIQPNKIYITNLDAVIGREGYYDHPHVKDRKPCFSEWQEKINNLLAGNKFKELVLLLKLYLQTYSAESPHCALGNWLEFRKRQPLRLKDAVVEPDMQKEREYLSKNREEDKNKFGEVELGHSPMDEPDEDEEEDDEDDDEEEDPYV